MFFPMEKKFFSPVIFNFHFRESPHFRHEFQALILILIKCSTDLVHSGAQYAVASLVPLEGEDGTFVLAQRVDQTTCHTQLIRSCLFLYIFTLNFLFKMSVSKTQFITTEAAENVFFSPIFLFVFLLPRVTSRTAHRKITLCLFLLGFALVHENLNHVKVTFDKSLSKVLKLTWTQFRSQELKQITACTHTHTHTHTHTAG